MKSLLSKSLLLLMSFGMILFSACEKKELPVVPHEKGNVTTATVNMEQDYKWQIFYDLKTSKVVGQNLKTAWDLGFETSVDGFHAVLNGSKMMYAFNTGKKDINLVTIADTAGRIAWDNPNGNFDSTAIGDWRTGNVYVIDCGINSAGISQGFWKVQLMKVDAQKYVIQFDGIEGGQLSTVTITKDITYNLSFFSFSEKQQVTVEPPKNTWDIVFTQYTHVFHQPFTPYLVTGCLLNRSSTYAVLDTVTDFHLITSNDIAHYIFSSSINTIGYNWKGYTGSTYVVYPDMSYVIHTRNNEYYKLHFTDFMANGVKGTPKWEHQKL